MDKTLSQLRILYVEDDDEVRTGVAEYLSFLAEEVITAADGQEGLEKFKTLNPDLIITDIKMPRMDGLAMIAHIRELNRNIPIIITTAYEDKDFIARSAELNVMKFVTKPIILKKLMALIEDCLIFVT